MRPPAPEPPWPARPPAAPPRPWPRKCRAPSGCRPRARRDRPRAAPPWPPPRRRAPSRPPAPTSASPPRR
eukprot:802211-Prymnesium_polylepis.1